jgi:hypothetical protein
MAINDAASNSLTDGITLSSFEALITSAFAANTGGDMDFEAANGWTGSTIAMNTAVNINYGVSEANSVSISRTDVSSGTGWNTASNNAWVSSGSNYLGFSGVGNATFTFGSGLADIGLTMLPRGSTRTTELIANLSNGGSVTTSTETTTSTNAVFFGIAAPTGTSITSLTFVETGGFVRYDDLGFVAASTPEPASVLLLGLGGLALLRRRKR